MRVERVTSNLGVRECTSPQPNIREIATERIRTILRAKCVFVGRGRCGVDCRGPGTRFKRA